MVRRHEGRFFYTPTEESFMKKPGKFFSISAGFILLLIITGSCSGASQNVDISFTGQVTWQDIEGGFYGIITPEGTEYLPFNLPDNYQVDGVTVDIIGTVTQDVMTMHMWGEPIEIQSIKTANAENPFLKPWYSPALNLPLPGDKTQAEILIMAASGMQHGLDTIERQVSSIARNLTKNGIEGDNIKNMLQKGLEIPGVHELVFLSETGKLAVIVPEKYEHFAGEDVSGQNFNSQILSYPASGMSEYFATVEGLNAVMVSYPVFTAEKKVAGYVSALFDPRNLTEIYSLPFLNGTKFDLMVAQPDGRILYDANPETNGQEMWNSSTIDKSPDLLSCAAHFQNAQAGTCKYTSYKNNSDENQKTDAMWTTVGLHETPWRIFVLSRQSDSIE